MHEDDIGDRAGRFLRERKGADEELICTVCAAWSVTLVKFSNYLGSHSLDSVPIVDETLVVPLPPLVPVTAPLVIELAKRKRVTQEVEFLISYSRDKKVAGLRLAAKGCYWANSELKDCELFCEVNPGLHNSRCKFCFPLAPRKAEAEAESESESSASEMEA